MIMRALKAMTYHSDVTISSLSALASSEGANGARNPMDLLPRQYFPLAAFAIVAASLLPNAPTLLPPFVSEEEAQQVSKRRQKQVEIRLGRSIRLGQQGFRKQRSRTRKVALLALVEVFGWSCWTGFTQDWSAGLTLILLWSSVLLRMTCCKIETPPLAVLLALLLLLIASLCDLLEYLPLLLSLKVTTWFQPLWDAVNFTIITGLVSHILSMPVAAGGWENVVDEEERIRVLSGAVTEEKEHLADTYQVSRHPITESVRSWLMARIYLMSAMSNDARGLHFAGSHIDL